MLPGFLEEIIVGETNYIRFEKFCNALLSRAENRCFLSTSVTHDRGRDGRVIGPTTGSHPVTLCSTLNRDIDAKVRSDLKRIDQTTKPDRLVYCSSQKLTETHIDDLMNTIRQYVNPPNGIQLLGAVQLAELAERFPEIFEEYYRAEIELIKSKLLAYQGTTEPAQTKGLRLALIAFGSDDAATLRKSLSRRAVLEVLKRLDEGAGAANIAERLSADLRLPRVLDLSYILSVLKDVENTGHAARIGDVWVLTSLGRREVESVPTEAARFLLCGRAIIRDALVDLTGLVMTDEQFGPIWSTLLDFLSELFYSSGLATVNAINEFLAEEHTADGEPLALERLIEQGASRIRATVSLPELAEEVEQAVRDMFTARSGPAFDWLSRVCERFVALCALGLETSSSAEILKILARYQLVLDSDIVLTLLCEGEPNHAACRDLLSRFRGVGGAVLISPAVLEEVAYHAHISEKDFRETAHLIGKLKGEDLQRYTANAFARAFHVLGKNRKEWQIYRNQFVGGTPRDYSKILDILQDEIMVQLLPTQYEDSLARQISQYLERLAKDSGQSETETAYNHDIGKSGRDGQILASIAAARRAGRQSGSPRNIVLLSSSTRLRRADHQFRGPLGWPEAVISLKALAYMLSLVPDVGLGAGTLRQALFDFGETAHLTDVERLALRVIRGSEQFSLPWARRRTLQNQLDKVIRGEAHKRDVPESVVRKQLMSGGDTSIRPEEVIVEAMREMAIHDAQTVELEQARRKIRVLEEQVEELKHDLNKAVSTSHV